MSAISETEPRVVEPKGALRSLGLNIVLERKKMQEHTYRGQLIRVIATATPGTDYWVARADIRVEDRKGVRFFPLGGPRREFSTKEAAEKNLIGNAKKFIDIYFQSMKLSFPQVSLGAAHSGDYPNCRKFSCCRRYFYKTFYFNNHLRTGLASIVTRTDGARREVTARFC